MREEKAPEENIQRMSEIFRFEMGQRIVSMLAEYLDTPTKVDSAIRATIAASAKLHGDNLGKDILKHTTETLLRLKEKAPKHSTEWLANSDHVRDAASSDADTSTGDVSDEEPTSREKAKKYKKRDRRAKRVRTVINDDVPEDTEMDIDPPATSIDHITSRKKDKKISSKWQWDIDATQLADDKVADAFSRTSDLFAYHALPIARRKLGSQASKKETRCEMQSLLDGMPQDEFEKWVESLQKLLDGDREMLARQDIAVSDIDQTFSRATPAPVDLRRKAEKSSKGLSGDSGRPKGRANSVENAHDKTLIKREAAAGSRKEAEYSPNTQIAEATVAFRHLSTEEPEFGRPLPSVEAADGQNDQVLHSNGNFDSVSPCSVSQSSHANSFQAFGMPVLSLLWGSDSLSADECVNDCVRITQTIMNNLKYRISAEVSP